MIASCSDIELIGLLRTQSAMPVQSAEHVRASALMAEAAFRLEQLVTGGPYRAILEQIDDSAWWEVYGPDGRPVMMDDLMCHRIAAALNAASIDEEQDMERAMERACRTLTDFIHGAGTWGGYDEARRRQMTASLVGALEQMRADRD